MAKLYFWDIAGNHQFVTTGAKSMAMQINNIKISFISRIVLMIAMLSGICTPIYAQFKLGDVPEYSYKLLSGKNLTHEKYRGKILVLEFWSHNSELCKQTMTQMKEINGQAKKNNVVLVGVNLDNKRNELQRYLKAENIRWLQIYDGRGKKSKAAKDFNVDKLPAFYIIDPDGVLVWSGSQKELNPILQKIFRKHKRRMIRENSQLMLDEKLKQLAKDQLTIARALLNEKKYQEYLETLANLTPAAALDDSIFIGLKNTLGEYKTHILIDAKARDIAMSNRKLVQKIVNLGKSTQQAYEIEASKNTVQKKKKKVTESINANVLRSKLEAAEKYEEAQKIFAACEQYEWIVNQSPESPIGKEAARRIIELKSRDHFAEQYTIYLHEKRADLLLRAAKSMETAGEIKAAMNNYRIILIECPEAVEAKEIATLKLKENHN
ncbi:TlpA family protein disulfide reductase [Planctomycetota bacterium]|nr:TlpA family protein disulfide reductase [Planctomycetota bacterium]